MKRTRSVRVDEDIIKEWEIYFPKTPRPELIRIQWSVFKLQNVKNKKK